MKRYIVESDFVYKGYRCVVIFGDLGFRCGYVGIPKGHWLYGKEFNDKTNIKIDVLKNEPIGKRSIISLLSNLDSKYIKYDLLFDVHGSLTYSGGGEKSKHPIESDLWWLGFDCGHCDDMKDFDCWKKYFGDDECVKKLIEIEEEHTTGEEIRTNEYVVNECKSLVEQIQKLGGKNEDKN